MAKNKLGITNMMVVLGMVIAIMLLAAPLMPLAVIGGLIYLGTSK